VRIAAHEKEPFHVGLEASKPRTTLSPVPPAVRDVVSRIISRRLGISQLPTRLDVLELRFFTLRHGSSGGRRNVVPSFYFFSKEKQPTLISLRG
jgi:hypothetical protein